MNEQKETKNINIEIPNDIHKTLKIKAINEDLPLKDLIIKILSE